MKNKIILLMILSSLFCNSLCAQHISDFTSLEGGVQNTDFRIPTTHTFQYIIEHGDALTEGGTLPDVTDFTGYVPIDSSSKFGYLSINSEASPGGVTILDIEFDESTGEWKLNQSQAVDFPLFSFPTLSNCSGTVTPWNTIISCEETTSIETEAFCIQNPTDTKCLFFSERDNNGDGYDDFGWAIEIDPKTKKVIDQNGGRNGADKLWALGNFKHENAVIHQNRKTVYQGADDTKGEGYLFKFVADNAEDLSSGDLYVYKGSKQGSGDWIQIDNNTKDEQNSTLAQCAAVGATNFGGIEDVEIDPIDGMIYFAVKREDLGGENEKGVVYRFSDSDPLDGTGVTNLDIYVGNQSYDGVAWGNGNDNLVFDDLGNLWVAQDEGGTGRRNYIWVVEYSHTQQNPKVKIFAQAPKGSEPTGLTFSPDYKYLFMSIQHPDPNNTASSQPDAFGNPKTFDKDVSLVIARKNFLGKDLLAVNEEIMITQYYEDEASNSKWVEVMNISNATIPAGSYFLGLYDQNDIGNITTVAPTLTEPIPAMEKGEVILFKNTGASLPNSSNLGNANQIATPVCNFNGDDVILISSTPGSISHTNRRDIIGSSGSWGINTSFIKGGDRSNIPDKDFDINNWIELSTNEDVETALTNTNLALGTQEVGPSIWNGSTWNKPTIPDRTTNVEIDENYTVSDGGFKAFDLTINFPLGFDNGSTESIVVYNDLFINDAFIIGDTESLLMINPLATISGIITKNENSTTRNNTHDITYWSSPVTNETIENVFTGVTSNRIFYYDQSRTSSSDPDNDPSGTYWDVWQIASGTMNPAEGYAAEGITGETGNHDISFTGAPNNGPVSYTLKGNFGDSDSENDFNLIGNPYPSAINIDSFFVKNADLLDPGSPLEPTAYFWTHTTAISNGNSGDYVTSDYATYNLMGGIGVGGDAPTSNIASGQGFFVRAINSGTVEFNNSMRIANANDQFFKTNTTKYDSIEKDRIWLNLTTDQGGFNQILIGFDDKATDGVDRGYDATRLDGGNPISFYSLIGNNKLVIQGSSSFSDDQTIDLGFDTKIAPRNFTISIDQVEGKLIDAEVYLVDHELNTVHDLKSSVYSFEQREKGNFLNRFSLQFINTALDTEEYKMDNDFIISNTQNGFKVHANSMVLKIRIYDLLGRLLVENSPNKRDFILDSENIKKGTVLIVQLILPNDIAISKKTIKY